MKCWVKRSLTRLCTKNLIHFLSIDPYMSALIRSAIKFNNFTEPLPINTDYDYISYGVIISIIQVSFIIFLIVCMKRDNRRQQVAQNIDYHMAAIIHR